MILVKAKEIQALKIPSSLDLYVREVKAALPVLFNALNDHVDVSASLGVVHSKLSQRATINDLVTVKRVCMDVSVWDKLITFFLCENFTAADVVPHHNFGAIELDPNVEYRVCSNYGSVKLCTISSLENEPFDFSLVLPLLNIFILGNYYKAIGFDDYSWCEPERTVLLTKEEYINYRKFGLQLFELRLK